MNHTFKMILFYLAMFATLGLFWFWMALPSSSLITLDPNVKLQCLSYAPFGKNESPMDIPKGFRPSTEQMDKDLAHLATITSCIRSYSSVGLEELPEIARKHGLKLWLGAWVSSDVALTKKEIDTTIRLAKENKDIVETVVVGNEALLRRDVSAAQLVGYINEVKQALPDMVITYADVWEFWNKHPEVAPAVDRVTIHILPYWEDTPISVDKALLHVKNIRELMQQKIPDKEIVIGETGWPSEGRMRESAYPSAVNQALFTRGFVKMAEESGWQYNFIEAFDQPWKRMSEGAVGGFWGLFDADRADKHILHGFVSNFPNALWLFISSCALSLVGLIWLWGVPTCSCKKAPYWFATLFGGSVALTWQANAYWIVSRNNLEEAWAILCLCVAFLLWLKLVRFLIAEEITMRGSMARFMSVITLSEPKGETFWEDVLHLCSISIVLVMALSLAFDGRYLNFELGTLGIIAVVYAVIYFSTERKELNGLMEKASGLILFLSALAVLVQESARNDFALNWVILVMVLGSTLWLSTSKLCGLFRTLLILVVAALAIVAMKEGVYVKESWVAVCAAEPMLPICQFRTLLGKVIYLNYVGLSGIVIAIFSVFSGSYILGMIAIVMGLFCLLTFNGFLGAIIVVLGWWIVGYRLSEKCTL
ncbi:glycoside hydrolase family 17 protein [Sulfurospirillum multivorans]|uniref:Endo-1,3-beta-glucanase btgC n=2 Tax=Sulfurospirillum multivorans TaxID=66821 RepID=A0AA86APN4_SULMK|nr:exo-beta-1,3-glucanase [Sulfurospirillum multivorans]AHJ13562.1 exo-beta-1 3-glucanase-like protein [Sulfurospirillum multivorans DSM 12446]QEH07052.1 exo-beta-1 3-glucanase-like protein [Sulfurospirillum multivorans]